MGAFEAATGPPLPVASRPAISNLKLSPRAFRAAKSGASIAAAEKKTGTQVSYSDSQPATAKFTVLKAVAGIRNGGRCVAKPRHGKPHGRKCTRYVSVGSFTHADTAGSNSFRFTGRVRGHRLRPGKYRLSVVPSNANGAGTAVTVSFRVKK